MPTFGWIYENAVERFWEGQRSRESVSILQRRMLACKWCQKEFTSAELLHHHLSLAHSLELPTLYIFGKPLLKESVVRSSVGANDVELFQCSHCEVQVNNGLWQHLGIQEFCNNISSTKNARWNVRLVHERAADNSQAVAEYAIRFGVPDVTMLDAVDKHFIQTLALEELNHGDLERFKTGLPSDTSVHEYGCGLGDYALGIILKERRIAFGPDLEIVYAEAEPWSGSNVGLRSIIRNTGTTASPPTVLSYLRENTAGAVLTTEAVPALLVGEAITLTTPFDYGSLPAGSYTLLASVNRSDFAETFKENNTYTTTLAVQPDLLVPADDVLLTPSADSSSVIVATIYNNGSITATNAQVGVYRRGTLDQPALLFTRTLPDLPPGGSTVITGAVDGQFGCGLFVAANPDQTLAEMTYVNNLASVATEGGYCANFVYTPTSGIEGTAVAFTDTSSGNVTAWQWDFGDGTTSIEQNPSHIYAKPGTYDVTLRISGVDGSDEFKRVGAVVVYKGPGIVDIFLPLMQK